MTPEQKTLLTRLETRVRQLVLQHTKVQLERDELRRQAAEAQKREEALKADLAHLQSLYDNLKVARMLELGDNDERSAKARLARLVREVDQCIALLKAE